MTMKKVFENDECIQQLTEKNGEWCCLPRAPWRCVHDEVLYKSTFTLPYLTMLYQQARAARSLSKYMYAKLIIWYKKSYMHMKHAKIKWPMNNKIISALYTPQHYAHWVQYYG